MAEDAGHHIFGQMLAQVCGKDLLVALAHVVLCAGHAGAFRIIVDAADPMFSFQ
mgnify:CR=1 FL=1